MAPRGTAKECGNVSVMVIQSFGRSPGRQGSEPALLGFSSVRLKLVPDQLRFSAILTLRRLEGSAQVYSRLSKIRNRGANFGLGWESSRGGCALGIRLVAGDVGLRQDYEAGTGNGGVHRGR
jgi:hypothetical protein